MSFIKGAFNLKVVAVVAGAFMLTLTDPATAEPDASRASPARQAPELSPFTKREQETIADVTKLLESYVQSYSGMGDSRGYASLWTFPNAGIAAGNVLRPGTSSFEDFVKAMAEYFAHRTSPLRTLSSEISVRPINDIVALGHVRYNFQETPNSTQRMFVSSYLCVKTEAGWRFYMAMDTKDSGVFFDHAGISHREWSANDYEK